MQRSSTPVPWCHLPAECNPLRDRACLACRPGGEVLFGCGRHDSRLVCYFVGMAAKKKSNNNKPGPWDDIARGVSGAAGAVKRTVISNPGNKNKASNLDKWLKGGNYSDRGLSDKELLSAIGKGAKAAAKGVGKVAKAEAAGIDKIVRKLTPLPDRKPKAKMKTQERITITPEEMLKLAKTRQPITPAIRKQMAKRANAAMPKAKKK